MVRTQILNVQNSEVYVNQPCELVFKAEFNKCGELSMVCVAGNKQLDQERMLHGMAIAMMEFAGSLAQNGTKKARAELQERMRDVYASTLMNYWIEDAWENAANLEEVEANEEKT